MQVVRGIQALTHEYAKPVVTIGNFDGVHLGHQAIIQLAIQKARARGGVAVAYTFRPHPQVALRSDARVPLLTTYDEKAELIGALGVDLLIEEPFSREFSNTAPQTFFNELLLKRLKAEAIVVGYDFAFGKERQGGLDILAQFCERSGVELTVVPAQSFHSKIVSSSKIREHLLAGRIEEANQLLGREFFYRGVVVKGEGRGRKIGFPTANLKLEDKLALPYGVYATHALVNGKIFPSVTNVGVRPTFQAEGAPGGNPQSANELPATVETYLLDQTLDLYGSTLEVRFAKRLRAEKRFSGIDELKSQIALDVESARRVAGSA